MKIKVASTVKGKLSIPFVYGTHVANTELEISDEQAKSVEIFNLIKSGLLEVDADTMHDNFVEYKNTGKSSINFSWGLYVKPGQTFFVEVKHTQGEEIKTFLKTNAITRVIKKKEDVKKINAPKSENKSNKKVEKKVDKQQESIVEISKNPEVLKDVIAKQKIPANVHIHKPTEPAIIKESTAVKEITEEDNGIKFVDQEQKKEKINRLHKFIKDKSSESV